MDWNDPVTEALHDVDAFPAHDESSPFDGPGNCVLKVETYTSTVNIGFQGWVKNAKLRKLREAVFDAVCNLAEIAKDEQIIHYLDARYPIYSEYLLAKYGTDR